MKRLIIHWTAGLYKPNEQDLEHYHYVIGYEKSPNERAIVYKGKYAPEDNIDCKDGRYAAHTGGGNTNAIGVAVCGMYGYKDPVHIGEYPLKPIQMEMCYEFCAKICKKYNIPVTRYSVMTHYEFGKKHPDTTSKGKVDIAYLSTSPSLPAGRIGDYIRNKITWYSNKLSSAKSLAKLRF